MKDTPWGLPRQPLRTGVFAVIAADLALVVACASLMRLVLPVGAAYPVKAGGLFGAVMLVAVGFIRRHHPFEQFGPANQTTTARAGLVAIVAGAIGEPAVPVVALAAAMAALMLAMLDGVDGWLARRSRMSSAFGARFDMEVDALLIMTLSILVWEHAKAGSWVLLSGLLRYLFVAGALIFAWMRRPLSASRRRQTVCVVQVAALIVAMLPWVTMPYSAAVAAIALGALAWSFAIDVVWLWRTAPRVEVRPTTARGRAFLSSS
jgi:phosphatidylglycerophosphate synthase